MTRGERVGKSARHLFPYETQSSTGDEYQMGLQIGAAIEPAPHATMKFDWSAKTVNYLVADA